VTTVDARPAGSILGTRVLRTEDPGLLRGANRYLNDLQVPGSLHAVFARADAAHAALTAVHVEAARELPGVVAVHTFDTLGVPAHHGFVTVHPDFARPPLATGRVRFAGEAIALVVAESAAAAVDGASAVWAGYEPLDAVVDPADALAGDAPVIFADHGSNHALVSIDPDPVDLAAAAGEGGTIVRSCRWNRTGASRCPRPTAGSRSTRPPRCPICSPVSSPTRSASTTARST
jgi:aerobic carbon-monoxide dehydrogenase large subunit